MFRKILRKIKNTLYLYISQIIEKFLYLILIIFISKYLGTAGLGQYASSFAIVGIFFIFINGGFDSLLIREISIDKNKIKDYLLNLIILKGCLGCLIFLAVLYMSNTTRSFSDIKQIIIVLALSNWISSINQIYYCILIAYEKMKYIMTISIVTNMVVVGLGIILLTLGRSLLHVVSCFFIGSIISFIFGIILVRRTGVNLVFKLNFLVVLSFIKKNIPFLLASIFLFMLFKIDIILLKLYKSNDAVGVYRAAYSFLMNLEVFPGFFMMALYPKFSRLIKRDRRLLVKLYKKSFFYLLLLNILMLVSLFIFADILISLVFGGKFIESAIILRYATIAIFFLFQNTCNVYFLNAINKPALNAFIFCSGVVINIVLDLFLIPTYSYYGVVIASIVAYLFIFISSTYVINKEILKLYILKL